MIDPGILTLLNVLCTVASTGVAIFVVFRDSSWRRHGLAAKLSGRIDAAMTAANNWFDTEHARELRRKVERHSEQLADHAGELKNVATKADIQRVEGLVGTVKEAATDAKDGIDRIEGLLMKKALNVG